jgi:hypothetical protein
MANNPHICILTRNAMLDAINATISTGGLLRIYSGTQPANADTALSGNTQLAELALSSTAFAAAASGTAAANAITQDSSADATGTATFASFLTSGAVRKIDVSVGTASADIIFNTVAFQTGAIIQVTAFSISLPA